MPGGPTRITDEHRVRVQHALLAVEGRDPLAVPGPADIDRGAGDLVEVVGVHRLAEQHHHVVGDVDDVVDRPLADRRQACLQPERRWGDRYVREHAHGETRAKLRVGDRHRKQLRSAAFALRGRVLGGGVWSERRLGDGVQLAGDPVDGHVVGTVRAHLELEHVVAERHVATGLLAHFERVRKDHDAAAVGTELDLGLREDHAVRLDPAELCAAELGAVRQDGSGQRDHDGLARRDVRRAADDRAHVRAGELHGADVQAVRVGMRIGAHHLADPEEARVAVPGRHAHAQDPLELGAAQRQAYADLLGRQTGVAVLLEPGQGYAHQCPTSWVCFAGWGTKLLQEAQVVLEEEPQVGHAVLEHRDPLDSHAERETLYPLGVVALVAHEAEHVRVDHARAHDLDPARPLAEGAERAVTLAPGRVAREARHVDLDTRLGEREVAGAQAHPLALAEGRARELEQSALEVGQRDVLIHRETLHLREHRGVRGVGVAPVDDTRHHDVDRRPLRLHRPDLHRRGVRPKQHLVREVEGVVVPTGRVPGRDVERREVVVVGLDLGTLDHPVAHPDEEVLDLSTGLGQQVQMAGLEWIAGQRDVDALGPEPLLERPAAERVPPLRDLGLQRAAHLVPPLADGRPLLTRQVGQRAQDLRELGLPAQVAHAQILYFVRRAGLEHGPLGLLGEAVEALERLPGLDVGGFSVHVRGDALFMRRRQSMDGAFV